MYAWTVWRVMADSVVLAGFLFVSERVDAGGKDQVEIPGITERFDKVEKKPVLVTDEPRPGVTPPTVERR